MQVIILAPTPPPMGGIAAWTQRMQEAELPNDWTVHVVDEKTIGNRQVFGKAGQRKFGEEIIRCCRIWKDLSMALNDKNAAVVHSCIPSTTFAMMREYVCAIIAHCRRRPFIIHFRCTVPNTTKGKMGHLILKLLCNKSDMIFALNEQTSQFLSNITRTRIRIIPNFVSEAEVNNSYSTNDRLERVIYVGGLVESKGIKDLLAIAKHMPNIQFVLIGKGNSELIDDAIGQGQTNVIKMGSMDHSAIKEELSKSDAFLFMSYFAGEGFSNALCEAMAAGLPCVVTDWAANGDMIGNTGGYVVGVHDIEAAIAAIHKLDDVDLRRKMSQANIKKVTECYVQPVVLRQYVECYEELIQRT